jgi:hypothetical protein
VVEAAVAAVAVTAVVLASEAAEVSEVVVSGVVVVSEERALPLRLEEVAEFLASNMWEAAHSWLGDKDVVRLLRAIIKQEGSISAFSRRHGLELSQLNKMLNGRRPVSRVVVKALGLRKVYVTE